MLMRLNAYINKYLLLSSLLEIQTAKCSAFHKKTEFLLLSAGQQPNQNKSLHLHFMMDDDDQGGWGVESGEVKFTMVLWFW